MRNLSNYLVTFPSQVGLTADSSSISFADLSGAFVASASDGWLQAPFRAFDLSTATDWQSASTYATPTGFYTGTTTTVVGSTSYAGEWLQIQLPTAGALRHYTLRASMTSGNLRTPRSYVVLGSMDGASWTLVDEQTSVTNWSNLSSQRFTSRGPGARQSFLYYRLVVRAVGNDQVTGTKGIAALTTFALHLSDVFYGTLVGDAEVEEQSYIKLQPEVGVHQGLMTNLKTRLIGNRSYSWETWVWDDTASLVPLTSSQMSRVMLAMGNLDESVFTSGALSDASAGVLFYDALSAWSFASQSNRAGYLSSGGGELAALSLVNLGFSTYAGPIFRLIRSTDGHETDIYVDSAGTMSTDPQFRRNGIQGLDVIELHSYLNRVSRTVPPQMQDTQVWATSAVPNRMRGLYVAAHSSAETTNPSWYAFNDAQSYWSSLGSTYVGTTGIYAGTVKTTDTAGRVYAGEWIQISCPTFFRIKSVNITPRTDSNMFQTRSPRTFHVLASDTGSSWIWLASFTNITDWTSAARTFAVPTQTTHRIYRLVVSAVGNGMGSGQTSVQINTLSFTEEPTAFVSTLYDQSGRNLHRVLNPAEFFQATVHPIDMTEATTGSYSVSVSSMSTMLADYNALLRYPPKRLRDVSPFEVFDNATNMFSVTVYDQPYGNGTYRVTSDPPMEERWRLISAMDYHSGTWFEWTTSVVGTDYHMIMEMPSAIYLRRLRVFNMHTTGAPSTAMRLYASNDGITYTQLLLSGQDAYMTVDNAQFSPMFVVDSTVSYKYYRLTFAGSGGLIALKEVELYGNEFLPHAAVDSLRNETWWHSAHTYTGSTGNYAGTVSTTSDTATQYTGEWIQVENPGGMQFDTLSLVPRVTQGSPRTFYLLGSDTGAQGSWKLLHTQTGRTDWAGSPVTERSFSLGTVYTYKFVRMVINQVGNNTGTSMTAAQLCNFRLCLSQSIAPLPFLLPSTSSPKRGVVSVLQERNTNEWRLSQAQMAPSTSLIDNRWHHVCAVASAAETRLYIDGELVGKATRPGGIVCNQQPFAVTVRTNTSQDLSLRLGPTRVYLDKALTPEEIRQNMDVDANRLRVVQSNASVVRKDSLMLYWDPSNPLSYQGGSMLFDLSGENNHGNMNAVLAVENGYIRSTASTHGAYHIQSTIPVTLGTGSWTLEVWKCITMLSATDMWGVFGIDNALFTARKNHGITMYGKTGGVWGETIDQTATGTKQTLAHGGTAPADTRLHQCVVVFENNSMKFYVDGQYKSTNTRLVSNLAGRIGYLYVLPNMRLGPMRVYNSALTESEIRQNYEADVHRVNVGRTVSGLVLHLDPRETKCYPGTGTTLFDLSGKGNHCSLTGQVTVQGGVIRCGADSRVSTPVSTTLSGRSFTLECWVRSSSCQNTAFVGDISDDYRHMLYVGSTTQAGVRVLRQSTGAENAVMSRSAIVDGSWHHVVGVFRTATLEFWVDGVLVGSQARTLVEDTVSTFSIGAALDVVNVGTQRCDYGPVRIWADKVLTRSEIRSNFLRERTFYAATSTAGTGTGTSTARGLLLHLDPRSTDCYAGSGTTLTDLSGNQNHCTLVNGASVVRVFPRMYSVRVTDFGTTPKAFHFFVDVLDGAALDAFLTAGGYTAAFRYNNQVYTVVADGGLFNTNRLRKLTVTNVLGADVSLDNVVGAISTNQTMDVQLTFVRPATDGYIDIGSDALQYVQTATAPSFGGIYTMEVWYNTRDNRINAVDDSTAILSNTVTADVPQSGRVLIHARYDGRLWFQDRTVSVVTKNRYDDGRWHHLVLTNNGRRTFFYVDGELVGSGALTSSAIAQPTPLVIGANYLGRPQKCLIGPVRVYTGVSMSVDQVQRSYWADRPVLGYALDQISSAARKTLRAAYSLAQLTEGYTGPVARIRRSADGVESDFYGDAEGNLGTLPLGKGTPLATFLSQERTQFLPIAALTGANTTLTDATTPYSGTYVVSQSSQDALGAGWNAFTTSGFWHSAATYDATTGEYTGSVTTTSLASVSYSGEWLQLDLPYAVAVTQYRMSGRPGYFRNRSPQRWVLLGSNTGDVGSWTLVDSESDVIWSSDAEQTFAVTTVQAFKVWRLVVQASGDPSDSTYDHSSVQICNLRFSTNVSGRILPCNLNPANVSNTVTTEGVRNGTYVVSESSTYTGLTGVTGTRVFDGDMTTSWRSGATFTSTTGAYSGTTTTVGVGGVVYAGEWVQLQSSFPFRVGSYMIMPLASAATQTAPSSFRLLASNSGASGSWVVVDTRTAETWTSLAKTFVLASPPEQDYRYWRIVVNMVGNATVTTGRDSAQIVEVRFFEDPEALVATWYDQSGGGRHATQSVVERMPSIDERLRMLNLDAQRWFVLPDSTLPTGNQAYTFMARLGRVGSKATSTILSSGGAAAAANTVVRVLVASNGAYQQTWSQNVQTVTTPHHDGNLLTCTYDGTTRRTFLNGTQMVSDTPGVRNGTTTTHRIGITDADTATTLDGDLRNLYVFQSALGTADRQMLETDAVYPFDRLSSTAKGAMAGIFALRLLNRAYRGPVLRLRRSTDNAEADFYSDTLGSLTLQPNGRGTTWSSWVGEGTAFVRTWYDQSGLEKHGQQTDFARQPFLTQGGLMDFRTGRSLSLPDGTVPFGNSAYTVVARMGDAFSNRTLFSHWNVNTYLYSGTAATSQTNAFSIGSDATSFSGYHHWWYNNDATISSYPHVSGTVCTWTYDGLTRRGYVNRALSVTRANTEVRASTNLNNRIGAQGQDGALGLNGELYYLLIFSTQLADADRNITEVM